MPRKRRQDPKQTTLAFTPSGRGGARPGAGRRRTPGSRVPHRPRERIPRHCPVHVTLRVLDGLPRLRQAAFVRAFRESLRRMSRPGFRVVHYSIQDNHAHFIVEAAGRERLANGMKNRRLRAAGTARQCRCRARSPRAVGAGARRRAREAFGGAGGAVRAVREPGVRTDGQGAGGPFPPRGEADADGGAAGAGLRAAERPQALPRAVSPEAAGGP